MNMSVSSSMEFAHASSSPSQTRIGAVRMAQYVPSLIATSSFRASHEGEERKARDLYAVSDAEHREAQALRRFPRHDSDALRVATQHGSRVDRANRRLGRPSDLVETHAVLLLLPPALRGLSSQLMMSIRRQLTKLTPMIVKSKADPVIVHLSFLRFAHKNFLQNSGTVV